MGRSKWKLIFFSKHVWKLIVIVKLFTKYKKRIRNKYYFKYISRTIFYTRSSSIPECMLGRYINLYKYNQLFKFVNSDLNTGYRLGEFFFTKKPFYYPQKERGKKKKAIKR